MIAVPKDDRCRCINPRHKGMCPNKATHETSTGTHICEECVDSHLGGMAHKLVKPLFDIEKEKL